MVLCSLLLILFLFWSISVKPWHSRVLPYPVQPGHAGEFNTSDQRPLPTARGQAGPAERSLLSGKRRFALRLTARATKTAEIHV